MASRWPPTQAACVLPYSCLAVRDHLQAIEIDQDDDDEDEMLRTLARHREAGLAAAREANRMTEGA